MRLPTPRLIAAFITLLIVAAGSQNLSAQSGCARCSAPNNWRLSPQSLAIPQTGVTTRYRTERVRFEETPSLPSPYYQPESLVSDRGSGAFNPKSRTNRLLVPTDSVSPDSSSPPKHRMPAKASGKDKPTVAEKVNQRYSDPRVIRMLRQLTPAGAESLYVEVSELIDGRHIAPAAHLRRVEGAINQFSEALDVASFREAARVSGSATSITTLQEELQQILGQIRVRSSQDALAVMREVQQLAADSIGINPSAIGLEFVYGATDSLDQFSMLLPPEKNGGPSVGLRDNVVGIGVEVEPHPAGLKILKLLPGGPAAQADLRRGDVITQVDGNELKQLELNRAVDFIVGPVGTPVQISALRGGRTGNVMLTRQKIAVHSVVDVHMEDSAQRIGYLKLEQFADSTMNEIDAALMNLHQQGMESLIMDLRGNPGGLLTTSIALSDRFLPAGTIVSTRGRTQADNTHETAQYSNTWKMPLVVLIDHNSASASEIFAAAIQENHRGIIIGEKSYGKGTVQTLFPLQTFPAALRLTTAKFYSPTGREMAGAGVTPDVKVTTEAGREESDDPVLREALKRAADPRVKEMAEQNRRTGKVAEVSQLAT